MEGKDRPPLGRGLQQLHLSCQKYAKSELTASVTVMAFSDQGLRAKPGIVCICNDVSPAVLPSVNSSCKLPWIGISLNKIQTRT